jgi:hypothetical protein
LLDQQPGPLLGAAVWSDTGVEVDLPDGCRLTDVLTGHTIEVHQARIPVAQSFQGLPMAVYLTGA